jgi:hypothetical protein
MDSAFEMVMEFRLICVVLLIISNFQQIRAMLVVNAFMDSAFGMVMEFR